MKLDYSKPEKREKKVGVRKLIKDLNLKMIYFPEDINPEVKIVDINRPGLQLAGFFDVFSYDRVQVLGVSEWEFMNALTEKRKATIFEKIFSYDVPLLLVSTNQEIDSVMLEKAKKYKRPVALSDKKTTILTSMLSRYLEEELAPQITVHGVLMDVDGVGILITGESGIGKSETALELINRNHRLVADDAVKIIKTDEDLIGKAPEALKYLIEVRGLGILDVRNLYGIGAIRRKKKIDFIVHLENWIEDKYYDRLGFDTEYEDILGLSIEKVTIPVRPGRNLGIIIEIAARNHRLKSIGYNAEKELMEKFK